MQDWLHTEGEHWMNLCVTGRERERRVRGGRKKNLSHSLLLATIHGPATACVLCEVMYSGDLGIGLLLVFLYWGLRGGGV